MNSMKFARDMVHARGKERKWGLRPARVPRALGYATLLAALLALWQACDTLADWSVAPGPPEVAGALWEGWASGRLASATWTAIGAVTVAMLVGTALATLLAVFAVRTSTGKDLLGLLILVLGPVPAVAVLPLLVLPLGASTNSLVLVAVCAVVLPIASNLKTGMQGVNPTILLVGQSLGLRGWGMLGEVLLPAALPRAIYGLRVGWASGWRTVVAAELVLGVAGEGRGFFTNGAGDLLPAPELLAGLLTISLSGMLVEVAFGLLERRTVVRWGMRSGP